MATARLTASELEMRANQLRRQIVMGAEQIADNLKPGHIYQEVLDGAGIDQLTMSGAVDAAARRHPIPTVLGGLAVGFLAYSVVQRQDRPNQREGLKTAVAGTASSLMDAATGVFRRRAEEKKRILIDFAHTSLASGAASIADRIEQTIGDATEIVPGGKELKPLLVSGLEILLAAALDRFVRPRTRP